MALVRGGHSRKSKLIATCGGDWSRRIYYGRYGELLYIYEPPHFLISILKSFLVTVQSLFREETNYFKIIEKKVHKGLVIL